MRVLISACLLGLPCRYDGTGRPVEGLSGALDRAEWVPVCPEQLGGLATPRPPAERSGDRVCTARGDDVTDAYRRGGETAAALAEYLDCGCALLKGKSPSCGVGRIYDGTFTGTLTADGVTTEELRRLGIPVFHEGQWEEFLTFLEQEGSA